MKALLLSVLLFGPLAVSGPADEYIKVKLFAPECILVAEFETTSIVIPEDLLMIYTVEKQAAVFTWRLEGIDEIQILFHENHWIFVKEDGVFKEVEGSRCNTTS